MECDRNSQNVLMIRLVWTLPVPFCWSCGNVHLCAYPYLIISFEEKNEFIGFLNFLDRWISWSSFCRSCLIQSYTLINPSTEMLISWTHPFRFRFCPFIAMESSFFVVLPSNVYSNKFFFFLVLYFYFILLIYLIQWSNSC